MARTRATASNVTVSFGLISFPVDLVPAVRSKSSKAKSASTKMVCPTCMGNNNLNPLKQQYVCSHDGEHGPFAKGDAGTALEIDGELHKPTLDQLAALAQVDGVRGTVALTVHPADQVEAHTMPSGNIYRLRPRGDGMHYGLVMRLVADMNAAFLCEVTNKGATLLYRALVRDEMLVLAELVRPSEFHEAEPVEVAAFDEKLIATGRVLVESLMEDFDPESFADRRKARLVAVAQELAGEIEPELKVVPSPTDTAAQLLELVRRSTKAA